MLNMYIAQNLFLGIQICPPGLNLYNFSVKFLVLKMRCIFFSLTSYAALVCLVM